MRQQWIAWTLVGLALTSGSFTMAGCQQDPIPSAQSEPAPIAAPASATAPLEGGAGDCQRASGIVAKANAATKNSLLMPINAEKASNMDSAAAQIHADVATLEAADVKPTMLRYAADMEQV